jgi:hypothetical protein
MFRRFVSACAIPAIGIPIALLIVVLTHTVTVPKAYPLTTVWCFAPLVWGIWAMLAPKSWVPNRLPVWGTILGLAVGLFAAFVINMPHALFDVSLSAGWLWLIAVGMAVFYFFLWMLVRTAYRALSGTVN